jgi:hypothetical protein
VPLSEFGPDIQKRFGYDEAKAKAWIAEQARQQAEAAKAEEAKREQQAKQGAEVRRRVQAIAHYLDDGGHVAIDPRTGQIYDPEIEAARRSQMLKDVQRYGRPHPSHSPR